MDVGDREVIVVGTVVVLVQHIHGGVDQCHLGERCASVQPVVRLIVVVAHHGCSAGSERVRHRGTAHPLVVSGKRKAITVPLVGVVLRVDWIAAVALLVQSGVAGQDHAAGSYYIGLDTAVVGRSTAGEERRLLLVARSGITLQRLSREAPARATCADQVLSAHLRTGVACSIRLLLVGVARLVSEARITWELLVRSIAAPLVLAGANGDHVLRGCRCADGVVIHNPVAICVLTRVTSRERDGHVPVGPDEIVGVRAVGGVVAVGIATPRVGVDACASVIRLLEERAQVTRDARQVVAVGVVSRADTLHRGPVFRSLEDELRCRRSALACSVRGTIAQHRARHVGAVPAVHVNRPVVRDAPAAIVRAGPVVDRHYATGRNIRVCTGRSAVTQAGVGHGDDLGGAVVATRVRRIGAHDNARADLVVLLWEQEVAYPRNIEHTGDGVQSCAICRNEQRVALTTHDRRPTAGDGGRRAACVSATLHSNAVQTSPATVQLRAELVGRMEEARPHDASLPLHLPRLSWRHAYLEGKVRDVVEKLCAGGCYLILPALLDRTCELDDVVATLTLSVPSYSQTRRNPGRLAPSWREGCRLEPDRGLSPLR